MQNLINTKNDSADLLLEGIESGYFHVTDSGSLSLDLQEFLKSEEGKERFKKIIKSMPRVNKK